MPKTKTDGAAKHATGQAKRAATTAGNKAARLVAPKRKRSMPKTLVEKVTKGVRAAIDAVMGKK